MPRVAIRLDSEISPDLVTGSTKLPMEGKNNILLEVSEKLPQWVLLTHINKTPRTQRR